MPEIQSIVDRYVAIFNQDDPALRDAAIRDVCTEDLTYTDPHAAVKGVTGLDAFVADARRRMPGARFALASAIDTHHDQARFQWSVQMPGMTEPVGVGFDVITLAGGRIRSVYGFIDRGRTHAMRTLVERYLACWNERDPDRLRTELGRVLVEKCTYVDPLAAVHGVNELASLISGVQQQFAGVTFVLGDHFEAHHDQARFTWHGMAKGLREPLAIGFDVAVFENDRIRDVHGFLDRMPG